MEFQYSFHLYFPSISSHFSCCDFFFLPLTHIIEWTKESSSKKKLLNVQQVDRVKSLLSKYSKWIIDVLCRLLLQFDEMNEGTKKELQSPNKLVVESLNILLSIDNRHSSFVHCLALQFLQLLTIQVSSSFFIRSLKSFVYFVSFLSAVGRFSQFLSRYQLFLCCIDQRPLATRESVDCLDCNISWNSYLKSRRRRRRKKKWIDFLQYYWVDLAHEYQALHKSSSRVWKL